MPYPTQNQSWIWSTDHKRYYRQEFRNGKWNMIWLPQATAQAPINTSTFFSSSHPGPNSAPPNSNTRARPDSAYGGTLPHNPVPPSSTIPSPYQVHSQEATSHVQPQAPQSVPLTTHALNTLSPQPSTTNQVPGRGQGLTVAGNYVSGRNHWEDLDPTFYVRGREFFKEGKVFAVLFTEPAGSNVTAYNTSISTVRFNEPVHTQIRRFIVVRTRHEFCYACPIFTYSGRATNKPGIRPEEHAIAYAYGTTPELLPGETGLTMRSICIVGAADTFSLTKASRIYFGIHHPIQYNVKVKDLGDVHNAHVPTLIGNWNMMAMTLTNQPIEVTNDEE